MEAFVMPKPTKSRVSIGEPSRDWVAFVPRSGTSDSNRGSWLRPTNPGTGLSVKECEICDYFVYIPQYGSGTASLNVTIAASIVLHQFGVWAGYTERTRDGNKFVVAERPRRQSRSSVCTESNDSIVEQRRLRRINATNNIFDECCDDDACTNLLDMIFERDYSELDDMCISSG
ncbi:putative tRNA/rRNA methyltransferase slr0955 [Bienertia sinuspersici]